MQKSAPPQSAFNPTGQVWTPSDMDVWPGLDAIGSKGLKGIDGLSSFLTLSLTLTPLGPVSPSAVNTWIPASPSTDLDPVQPDRSKVIFNEMATNSTDAATSRDSIRGTGDGVDTFMSSTQKLRIITDSSRDVKVSMKSM